MSTVLARYRSSSGPKSYEVILGGDGVMYCNCPGWVNRKTCKHLLDYKTGGQGAERVEIQPQKVEDITKPIDNNDLDAIVKRATTMIREIK